MTDTQIRSALPELPAEQTTLSTVSALALITHFTRASHRLDARETELSVDHIIKHLDSITVEDRIIVTLMLLKAQFLPENLLFRICTDQIEVASILLEKRSKIEDNVLLDVLSRTGADHHRAIAARPDVSADVAARIVDSGHEAALVALVDNRNAKIAPNDFARLMSYADRFHLLRIPLVHRDDTPEDVLVCLKTIVSGTLGSYIDCILGNRQKTNRVETARQKPDEAVPRDWERFTGNLAMLADLSCDAVERVVGNGSVRALAMVARSIGMDRATFGRFVDLVAQSRGVAPAQFLPVEGELNTLFYEVSPAEARLALERNLVGY